MFLGFKTNIKNLKYGLFAIFRFFLKTEKVRF